MPATIERAVPYMAFAKRVSSVGAKVTFLSATVTLTAEAKVLETLPLGPSTRTVPWVTTTLTLSGMGTGCLPIRLMVRGGLPNVAKQFTAGLGAAAVLILQQALRGGEDADAEAVQDARNLGVAVVEAAAGRGDADQAREGGRAGDIFHRHDERLVPLRVDAVLEVGDIALGLEPGQLWEEVARQVKEMGGEILTGYRVSRIEHGNGKIAAVEAQDSATGERRTFCGDYFFSTLPVQDLLQA